MVTTQTGTMNVRKLTDEQLNELDDRAQAMYGGHAPAPQDVRDNACEIIDACRIERNRRSAQYSRFVERVREAAQ